MNAIEEFFQSDFGTALKAVLVLILAFIVAAIAKNLIVKLLAKTKLADLKTPDGKSQTQGQKIIDLIGKLVQLIVFLLFVPGIFEILGMDSVSTPIVTVLERVLGYIPNILAAGVILWVGFYIAKLVKELLIPVLNKLEVNRLQKMAGIEVSEEGKLSNTVAYIVYVLILIPVIITALYALNIKAISDPAIDMLSMIFSYIPSILAALIIISLGYVIARFIGNIITRLIAASGLDKKIEHITTFGNNVVFSTICGKTVEFVLIVFFVVESLNILHLGVLSKIGAAIIAYLPYVLAAFLILLGCVFLASLAKKTLEKNGYAKAGTLVQYLIYVIGAFFILNQLGIARSLVDATFILIVAALAVAFAISFGVGGRTFAKNVLAQLQSKMNVSQAVDDLTEKK